MPSVARTAAAINVLIVDDHASFRQPLASVLEHGTDIHVVGQAGTATEARALLVDLLVDPGINVITVDLGLPDGDGVDLIREIRALVSDVAALVITADDDPERLAAAVEAGAAGLIHKSAPPEDILAAIRTLGAGEPLLTPAEVVHWLGFHAETQDRDRVATVALARLSRRERDVLQRLAVGLSDREIADDLAIGHETVRSHMANILGKLGVESRLQAVVFAVRHGAITIR